jgi:hypothetical protein
LGDLMTPHPGDALLADRMSELHELAARVRGKSRRGIPFYKPPGSESSENMYLADYLAMIGLPVLPVAQYPKDAKVAFLPVQAAADAKLLEKMQRHLKGGAALVVTPALLRALGPESFSRTSRACISAGRWLRAVFRSEEIRLMPTRRWNWVPG